ncbi:MAG: dihydrofolate reductase [Fibrobacteraceae bacterium]|nr:dihydrofolate reductase [Fibrobacteraceae bacterium]
MMKISAIVAVSENNVIGKNGHLPWHLSQDLKRFKAITSGHHILLGRKNYEDIGRPLPNRVNLVLTRDVSFSAPGCTVCHSLKEAFKVAEDAGESELFIIGGAQIYASAMPFVKKLYLTRVQAETDGEVLMPQIGGGWKLISEEKVPKTEKDDFPCVFRVLERE